MSETKGRMPRISSFDEMPYDECLLDILRDIGNRMDAGPKRDAFRILAQLLQMDMNRGHVLGQFVIEPVLKELESLCASDAGEEQIQTLRVIAQKLQYCRSCLTEEINNLRKLELQFKKGEHISLMALARRAQEPLIEAKALAQNKIECHEGRIELLLERRR